MKKEAIWFAKDFLTDEEGELFCGPYQGHVELPSLIRWVMAVVMHDRALAFSLVSIYDCIALGILRNLLLLN